MSEWPSSEDTVPDLKTGNDVADALQFIKNRLTRLAWDTGTTSPEKLKKGVPYGVEIAPKESE